MNLWTSEDISKILIQLDDLQLPFKKYSLCRENEGLILLGRGGSAEVYEAQIRSSGKLGYALKVIGFRNQNVDSEFFNEAVQVQMDIGVNQDNVVHIQDHVELWVSLDENDNVISAITEKPDELPRTTIKLQFVMMEKVPSVISRTKAGNIKVVPKSLVGGDEKEILSLALDIGQALKRAHDKNILHRDVKLENVFYSEKKKRYKLGDFGIAKKMEDGFASTIAFTKGYAAPEVRSSDDRYDNTADIYSFGMMLYVLVNGLKFPDSNTYNVNSYMQYAPGYILPEPECLISDDLYYIIAKACMYNPDDRYQKMDDMLLDLETLMYGFNLGYKKAHKKTSLVVGSIMLALGVVTWKLTMSPKMIISFSFWEYIFLAVCLGKGVLKALKKDTFFVSVCVFGVGIYLMIVSGFTWIKLLFLLWMTFSSGTSSGYLSAGVLIANVISLIQQTGKTNMYMANEYSWVAITIISIAIILLYQYSFLNIDDRKTMRFAYFKKGKSWPYWILLCLTYHSLIINANNPNPYILAIFRKLCGDGIVIFFDSFDRMMVGVYGLAFCIFWIGREQLLIFIKKRQIKKLNEQYEREYYD